MSWITTYTGTRFDLLNPTVDMIDIRWIARGLSVQPRFLGHTKKVITGAQHSVMVSILCPTYPLRALLHDGSEAALCDLPSPLKNLPELAGYREIEERVQNTIYRWAGVENDPHEDVKLADEMAARLEAESVDGLVTIFDKWTESYPDPGVVKLSFRAWPSEVAEQQFLHRYAALTGR